MLFDEPFSALDPLIRRDMQDEVLKLQRELKKTMIFITHDLMEALKLGNRIAIMKDGAFVQVGTPEEVVAHPADSYVADFIRDVPRAHVLTARTIMAPVRAATASLRERHRGRHDRQDLLPLVVNSDLPLRVIEGDVTSRRGRPHRRADRDAGGRRLMVVGVGKPPTQLEAGAITERVGVRSAGPNPWRRRLIWIVAVVVALGDRAPAHRRVPGASGRERRQGVRQASRTG